MSKNTVHIVNFIRGCEPRNPEMDLVQATREELRWTRELDLPATWLFQYDALLDPAFTDLFRDAPGNQELGLWFEFPQPLVEKAGLPWRGRYPWDWHSHVGFSVGYTPDERRRMADLAVAAFKERFGRAPTAAGSWMLDAVLIEHLVEQHGFAAFCLCKDQWGTDGYSLWGGYWNGAYFPSRKNAFVPAQTVEGQIHAPVYRMLGSDPIYQYDGCAWSEGLQDVFTLEPVYIGKGGGGSPAWTRWFFRTIFDTPSLAGGYTQTGQENSFGWPKIGPGYADQLAQLAQGRADGRFAVETMTESGRAFAARHELTPALAVTALEDWREEGRASVWYNSRFQRVNLYRDAAGGVRVRDWRVFDERYAERYLDAVCDNPKALYDAPPAMDGLLWADGPWPPQDGRASGLGDTLGAGVFFTRPDGEALRGGLWTARETPPDGLWLEIPLDDGGRLGVQLDAHGLSAASDRPFGLAWRWKDGAARTPDVRAEGDTLRFMHEGFAYGLRVARGRLDMADGKPRVAADASHRLRLEAVTL